MDATRLLALFVGEGRELLTRVDAGLTTLERAPEARASIDEVFRALHSLKGMSATVGLGDAAAALHAGETVLAAARDTGELVHAHVEALLALHDAMRDALDAAEQGHDTPDSLRRITTRLDALVSHQPVVRDDRQRVNAARAVQRAVAVDGARWKVDVTIADSADIPSARATIVTRRLSKLAPVLRIEPDAAQQADDTWDRMLTLWLGAGAEADVIEATVRGAGDVAECHVTREVTLPVATDLGTQASLRTVRIPAQRLDDLLDLVGELLLARDRLVRTVRPTADEAARTAMDDASRLITQLRDAILTSRMVPLSQVFDRFPRHVRETAGALDKEIELVLEGGELEVDRSLLDELGDPLLHLIRNAIDHGLEGAADRQRAGKPSRGRLVVRATRDASMVAVTVADDGRGVDRARVVASAAAQGVEDAAALAADDQGLLQLLARPGLSTADVVTSLSGRGVGMDAVQSRVHALGGRIDLATAAGAGTAITIRLPLSVAMLRALLVRVAGETYAVPLTMVHATHLTDAWRNLAALPPEVTIDGQRLRTISLRTHLGLPAVNDVSGHLVVLECATGRVALHVDACTAQQEIVVKPLQRVRGAATRFSGGTILPDGTPSLILDINSLP